MFTKDMSTYRKTIILLESIFEADEDDEGNTIVMLTPDEIKELRDWYFEL